MIIGGIVLEACIRIYEYYLVFATYDCPFEEGLTVSLLDKNGRLLETKDIFVAYYTDVFLGLNLYPPNIMTFDFLYKGLWRIEVFPPTEKADTLKDPISIWKRKFNIKPYWKMTLNEEDVLIPLKVR
ncbi:unnamed protein product [Commensalibacter communis]|uniref:hypothetical protein n=1 Tax=Commensalibacter communis TaxID=2972786 RepID=UPI0022FFA636|nr:hypothetical protein [Commensalibacter communis]CAI3954891.1 unnamed protein product [Commensalibacter communis]